VQAKINFYVVKRAAAKAEKKERAAVWTSSGEAGPSIIYVESSSGSELDDAFRERGLLNALKTMRTRGCQARYWWP
jgi:hypothetical protein